MEGPAFSTRAESKLYRSWGADISDDGAAGSEAGQRGGNVLSVIACVTDYDSWWTGKPVDVATVIKTLNENIALSKTLSSWQ